MAAKSLLSGQSGDLMASAAIVDAVREHPAGVENVDTGVDPDLHRDDVFRGPVDVHNRDVTPTEVEVQTRHGRMLDHATDEAAFGADRGAVDGGGAVRADEGYRIADLLRVDEATDQRARTVLGDELALGFGLRLAGEDSADELLDAGRACRPAG